MNTNKTVTSTFKNTVQKTGDDSELLEKRIREHEMLLYKVAVSLGYFEEDVSDLVYQVFSYATRNYADKESRLPLRVWLSKMMVYKCIYNISSKLFSQNCNLDGKPAFSQYDSHHTISAEPALLRMPLSFRAAYALYHQIGFDETEIAAILNIDVANVKKRLNKALLFINFSRG